MLGINTIQITPELLLKVAEIDEFKGLWQGLERHTTALHMLGDFADHGEDVRRLIDPLKDKNINADVCRILNAMQLGGKGLSPFKDSPNELPVTQDNELVGVLETAAPDDAPVLLQKLCDWLADEFEKGALHPLILIAVFTSIFLQISPFEKGNMRTVRFLILTMLLKAEYSYAAYISLNAVMDARAQDVYQALKHNQDSLENGRPDWSVWISSFLDLLLAQKHELYERLYEKQAELSDMSALSAKVMELFKTHQRLQMKEIIRLTNGRRATLKLRLQELIEGGYIKRHGAGRATWYSLV